MDTILYFSPLTTRDAYDVLAGMRDAVARRGCHVQTVQDEPTDERIRKIAELWNPLGAVVYCSPLWGELNPALFRPLPAVMLCHDPETLPPGALSVDHESAETGRTAARELLAAGLRSFAYVHDIGRHYWSRRRARAFAATVRLHGCPCKVFDPGRSDRSASIGGSVENIWQQKLRSFLRSLPVPCAVFAANDATAVEVLAAARHEGIDVPGSLAVLGVDDDKDVCERTVPSLSSIAPDFHRAGVLSAQLLLKAVEAGGGGAFGHALSFGDLGVVRRASTRPAGVRDPVVAKALELIRREACAGLRPARVAALFAPNTRRQADLRFRRAVGRTVGAEIRAVQLQEVKRLLARPSMQIKAIGDFCGFATAGSLRKFFRRETGMSLRDWRRAQG